MRELQQYCNIEKISGTTKYVIHKVYKEKKLSSLNSNNKFQLYVEHAIQKALKENGYKPLYLSHTQLLEKLHLVNNNYRIFNDKDNQDLLIGWITNREFYSRNSLATASKILYQWADRRLEKMEERGFITYEDGYCLVREDKAGKSIIKKVTNVSVGSDLERSVKECYNEAYERIFPNSKNSSSWIPPDYQNAFSFELRKSLKNHIEKEYIGAYKVKVITSLCRVENTLKDSDVQTVLNDEAVKKLKTTKQLNNLTGTERENFISELIKRNPSISYKDLLVQAQERRQNLNK